MKKGRINRIDGNHIELQKNKKLEPSSHPSHPSHFAIVADNASLSDIDSCNKIEYNLDNANPQQIQLKHSPFAEIYTDKINLKEIEDKANRGSNVNLSTK